MSRITKFSGVSKIRKFAGISRFKRSATKGPNKCTLSTIKKKYQRKLERFAQKFPDEIEEYGIDTEIVMDDFDFEGKESKRGEVIALLCTYMAAQDRLADVLPSGSIDRSDRNFLKKLMESLSKRMPQE